MIAGKLSKIRSSRFVEAMSKTMPRPSERLLLGTLGIAVIVLLWQAVAMSGLLSRLVFASPADTVAALVGLIATGELFPHLAASGILFGTALATAVVTGVLLGFVAGWFRAFRAAASPHIALLYSTPSIGLLPLFIVVFGLGFKSQFAVVFLFAFFPPYYAAVESVSTVDRNLLRVARSYNARDLHIFRTIILPGSVPLLLSGVRFAVGKAIAGVILAELYASTVGLGYLLSVSGFQFRTARVFAVILILASVGVLTSVALRWAEDRFDVWRPRGLKKA